MANDPQKKKPAPTLYAIIAIKLAKGAFFVSLAIAAYVLSDNNLPEEYKNLLIKLNHWTHLNPEKAFWVELASKVDTLTEARMLHVALGTFIYSLFALVEGVGLMFRSRWIGWLSIGESAFFIPIEIFELLRHFTPLVGVILVLDVVMVWYLFQNRERLFGHHH